MDFMNLNQSAHGDREFGFIETRMRLRRKTVVGHWQRPGGRSARSAPGRAPPPAGTRRSRSQVARFGDNMREVAVTEGDKVEAQIRLGVVGQRLRRRRPRRRGRSRLRRRGRPSASRSTRTQYDLAAGSARRRRAPRVAARRGAHRGGSARASSTRGGFRAFTDTFEDLRGPRRSCPASPRSG